MSLFFAVTAHAKPLELNYPKLPGMDTELSDKTTLPELINYLFSFFIFIGGIIAFGALVFAGFLYMASGANPGLRVQATARIKNTFYGLALLFGSYLILNTINPELVKLHSPGIKSETVELKKLKSPSAKFGSGLVDLDTLRYGGVIVFNENNWPGHADDGGAICQNAKATEGRCESSDAILHAVGDEGFAKASYIQKNDVISSIKILGECKVWLQHAGDNKWKPLGGIVGPTEFALRDHPDPDIVSLDDQTKGLTFIDPIVNNAFWTCMGYSIKVYQDQNYNDGLIRGHLTILDNDPDLSERDFVASVAKLENKIRSLRVSRSTTPSSQITLCDGRKYEPGDNGCAEYLINTPGLEGPPLDLDEKTSSIRFDTKHSRQAGVVVYENLNFGGRQEVFIASDKNLNPSFVQENKISSFKIIGRYRVTLYSGRLFKGNWIRIDNSDPASPQLVAAYNPVIQVTDDDKPEDAEIKDGDGMQTLPITESGGVLEISDLRETIYCIEYKIPDDPESDCKKTINDTISSIKIELPYSIVKDQNLIPAGDIDGDHVEDRLTRCDNDPSTLLFEKAATVDEISLTALCNL